MATFAARARPASTRSLLLCAVALVLLGVAIGASVVYLRPGEFRSPLDSDSDAWGPDSKSPLYYRSVTAPFTGKTNYVLRFRPHARFRFGMDIRNRGSSPVRIDGVVTDPAMCCAALRFVGFEAQHRPNEYSLAGSTSGPLTIPPGGHGYVIPTMETGARCHGEAGSGEFFESVRLKYSYRGKHKTQDYSMPAVIGIVCGNPKQFVDRVLAE